MPTAMLWAHCSSAISFSALPNGCELPVLGPQAQVSGQGSLLRMQLQEPASQLPLANAAESPVRSSELLGISVLGYTILEIFWDKGMHSPVNIPVTKL